MLAACERVNRHTASVDPNQKTEYPSAPVLS
jgi:hypothetical protein